MEDFVPTPRRGRCRTPSLGSSFCTRYPRQRRGCGRADGRPRHAWRADDVLLGPGLRRIAGSLLTVPVFRIAGSSWLTLRLVPIALSVVAAIVVWRVGRRTIGEPAAGVAGGLAWIWPPFVIYKLTHQWGFYASGTLYSALVLLLTLRLAERPSKARAGTFGLVVGLALWQSAQLVPIVVTAIVWAVWRRRSVLRYAWIAAVFAVIGALPSIVWNVCNDWGSSMSPIEDTTTYLHRLHVFASPLLPMLLGLRTPFAEERLLPAIPTLLLYAAIAALSLSAASGRDTITPRCCTWWRWRSRLSTRSRRQRSSAPSRSTWWC